MPDHVPDQAPAATLNAAGFFFKAGDKAADQAKAWRAETLKEGLAQMPQYFAAIKKTLVMRPHQVEIVAMPQP